MSLNRRGRLRWQCRRSLLELDLVFARFFEHRFDRLDENQLTVLEEVLCCEDHDLWAMINGSKPCPQPQWRDLIGLLRMK